MFNTFAPVVKSVKVKLLLALAFIFNMHVHQLDISNSHCYADVKGDVYTQPTSDFAIPTGNCFKLEKSLYGLRSLPRSWKKTYISISSRSNSCPVHLNRLSITCIIRKPTY